MFDGYRRDSSRGRRGQGSGALRVSWVEFVQLRCLDGVEELIG